MSKILQIDTSTDKAHVAIAQDGVPLQSLWNHSQKDHAAFLQAAISQLSRDTGISLKQLDAVAVTIGPGSYTGLRVGLASAKGLCYVLGKPLIALNTLEVLTVAAMDAVKDEKVSFYCPMIDARRMEVFTAIYTPDLKSIIQPCALILDETSFADILQNDTVGFFGNGAGKFADITRHPNASFFPASVTAEATAKLASAYFSSVHFADLAYAEPLYIKEFQDISAR